MSKDINLARMFLRRRYGFKVPDLKEEVISERYKTLSLSNIKELQVVSSHGISALDIDLSEGQYLLSGCQAGSLAIHDVLLPPGVPKREIFRCPSVCQIVTGGVGAHKFNVSSVQWYPHDTGVFTSSGMDGSLKIWDANSLTVAMSFDDLPGGAVYDHGLSRIATHGLVAVAGRHHRPRLCDPGSGSNTHELIGHTGNLQTVLYGQFLQQ